MKLQITLDNGDVLNAAADALQLFINAEGTSATLSASIPPIQVPIAQFPFQDGRFVYDAKPAPEVVPPNRKDRRPAKSQGVQQ
jgi:hypothetical protein